MPFLTRRRSRAGEEAGGGGMDRNAGIALGGIAQQDWRQEGRKEGLIGARGAPVFPRCANARCASGWIRLWRSRSRPVFEQGWCCSPECTRAQLEAAVSREMNVVGGAAAGYRHRIPLGLSMLEKGWITAEDLRQALAAQRAAGGGRLGQWLVRGGSLSEAKLTRALALQWSCPVLGAGFDWRDAEAMAPVLPRLFVDALGGLPLRLAAQRILYLGFADRPDPVLAVALERMLGLRIESGVVEGLEFRAAHAEALKARYAPVELLEAASESSLARALASAIEKAQPLESRLVRVHDFLWLRMWMRRQAGALPRCEDVRDLVCTLALKGGMA
jgi:hypothetical protein